MKHEKAAGWHMLPRIHQTQMLMEHEKVSDIPIFNLFVQELSSMQHTRQNGMLLIPLLGCGLSPTRELFSP
jgi:hypothetical protein